MLAAWMRGAHVASDPRMKILRLSAGMWFLAFVVVLLLDAYIGAFVIVLIAVPLGLVAVAILIQSVRVSLWTGSLRNLWPAVMVALLIMRCFGWPVHVGAYVRLLIEERQYEEAMSALVAGDENPCRKLRCIVENKEMRQVAFLWDGFGDNWYGVCHDPTGIVLKANLHKRDWSNRYDPEYRKAANLFGGDMIGAARLWGNWYRCDFT